jgi:uncharacterized protein (TIGR00661 family)
LGGGPWWHPTVGLHMNIVYGVSGEGLGHVFEAIEMIELLRREGHTVKVFTFGDRACCHLDAFHPTRIEGLSLHVNSQELSLVLSVVNNLRCIPFYLKNWRRLINELRAFEPDVFVTSYEPFTTIASHWLHKPLISMDNQNELLYIKKPREAPLLHFKLAQWLTRIFTYRASYYLVKSQTKIDTGKDNVYFVSPYIQNEIRSLSPTTGEHVLVYLTKPNRNLIKLLKLIPERFIVYCNNQTGNDTNITYRASGPSYLPDLNGCKAIIGTTGFSLINDAIYLRKPYFGVPIRKQFEQVHNAYFLRESGIGEFSLNVTKDQLEHFLSNLTVYQNRFLGFQMKSDEQKETLHKILEDIEALQSSSKK